MYTKALSRIAIFFIGFYRTAGSSHVGGMCRFEPSCSQYALDSFHEHSFWSALGLTISRIFRCRPGSRYGYDPVPKNLYREKDIK